LGATIAAMASATTRTPSSHGALTRAVRDAAAFDPSGLAPLAGLRAAVGLVAALAIGLAVGSRQRECSLHCDA
jgi:hypothetical protein